MSKSPVNLSPLQQGILTTNHRLETELLICCARGHLDREHASRIQALLLGKIDWDYLIRTALQHGLLPLLNRHLTATCPDLIPKRVADYFHEHHLHNNKYNLLLTGELLKLLKLFESHGIQAIPFKGLMLASSLYQDLALREFGDLDILVPKRDVPLAREVLASCGYASRHRMTKEQEATLLELRCEQAFLRADDMVLVDLHWGIVPRHFSFAPDPESWWQTDQRLSVSNHNLRTLPPEDLVLPLCVHGAKHCWERLGWICDLAELMRANTEIDWRQLLEEAGKTDSDRMVLLGLYLASDLLGAPLPEEVSRRAQSDRQVQSLARHVYATLFGKAMNQNRLNYELFYLRAMKRQRDRVRHFLDHLAPTPLEWDLLPLPPSLSFLHYLLRPIRLAGKHGLKLMNRLLPGSKVGHYDRENAS